MFLNRQCILFQVLNGLHQRDPLPDGRLRYGRVLRGRRSRHLSVGLNSSRQE